MTCLFGARQAGPTAARVTVRRRHRGNLRFAVDPHWQGRGIGRDVLRRLCLYLRAGGMRRVQLEVEVDNDRALELYTSIGFIQRSTEDYYALSLA